MQTRSLTSACLFGVFLGALFMFTACLCSAAQSPSGPPVRRVIIDHYLPTPAPVPQFVRVAWFPWWSVFRAM